MEKVVHSPGLLILLFGISGLLSWLVYWLFRLYQGRSALGVGWVAALEVNPEELGGFSYSSLALIRPGMLCLNFFRNSHQLPTGIMGKLFFASTIIFPLLLQFYSLQTR